MFQNNEDVLLILEKENLGFSTTIFGNFKQKDLLSIERKTKTWANWKKYKETSLTKVNEMTNNTLQIKSVKVFEAINSKKEFVYLIPCKFKEIKVLI